MELSRRKRAKKYRYIDLYPRGVIDIIQTHYPDRVFNVSVEPQTLLSLETLFSEEEWRDILSKSRLSYEQWIKLKNQKFRNIN